MSLENPAQEFAYWEIGRWGGRVRTHQLYLSGPVENWAEQTDAEWARQRKRKGRKTEWVGLHGEVLLPPLPDGPDPWPRVEDAEALVKHLVEPYFPIKTQFHISIEARYLAGDETPPSASIKIFEVAPNA